MSDAGEPSVTAEAQARPGRVSIRKAAQILAGRDPVLARLVDEAGLPSLPRPAESHFGRWSARSSTSSWPGPRPGPSTAG